LRESKLVIFPSKRQMEKYNRLLKEKKDTRRKKFGPGEAKGRRQPEVVGARLGTN